MSQETGKNQLRPETETTPMPDSKEQKLGLSMLTKVALAVVVVTSLAISISCVMRHNQLEAQKAELRDKIASCDQDIAEVKYLLNAPVDEEYIARVAREKLHLHFPDEVIYYGDIND